MRKRKKETCMYIHRIAWIDVLLVSADILKGYINVYFFSLIFNNFLMNFVCSCLVICTTNLETTIWNTTAVAEHRRSFACLSDLVTALLLFAYCAVQLCAPVRCSVRAQDVRDLLTQ